MRLATLVFSSALCLVSASSAVATASPKKPEPPPLPPVAVRGWLIAPSPAEAWTLRIDNEADTAIRVPADIRLLRIEADVFKGKSKRTVRCELPAALRPDSFPERRALVLQPGQSYIEKFDPRLFCFGANSAALAGANIFRTRFGWSPAPSWSKKAPEAPFAADTLKVVETAPLREVRQPTFQLSFTTDAISQVPLLNPVPGAAPTAAATVPPVDAEVPNPAAGATPAASAKPAVENPPKAAPTAGAVEAPVDEKAPKLELTSEPFADADRPATAVISLKVKNAGLRPMHILLRSRMSGFSIDGPDGHVECDPLLARGRGGVPVELFETMKPNQSQSFGVVLSEICPSGALYRPGLYRVTARFAANESGEDVGVNAHTETAISKTTTLLRVGSGREPFYATPPRAVPTPPSQIETE